MLLLAPIGLVFEWAVGNTPVYEHGFHLYPRNPLRLQAPHLSFFIIILKNRFSLHHDQSERQPKKLAMICVLTTEQLDNKIVNILSHAQLILNDNSLTVCVNGKCVLTLLHIMLNCG